MKYLKLYESVWAISFKDWIYKQSFRYKKEYREGQIDPLVQKTINCVQSQISDLIGIEEYVNLETLICDTNFLKTLKGIENLINLKYLSCSFNQLPTLKGVENLTNLVHLDCRYNELKNLDELLNLPKLEYIECHGNNWEYPLPQHLFKKSDFTTYSEKEIKHFKEYNIQKRFIDLYPERVNDLKEFGFHEKIKEEFPDLIEGSEFGFFSLKN